MPVASKEQDSKDQASSKDPSSKTSSSSQDKDSSSGKGSSSQKSQGGDSKQQMQQALEKLVDSQPLAGSAFKFICRCKMCGWQTMQQDEDAGKKLVVQHAQVHWPAIQAHMNQGQSADTATQPKRQEEPTGSKV